MKDIIKTAIGIALGNKMTEDIKDAKEHPLETLILVAIAAIIIIFVFVIYYATR